jgi:hypothetical protein
MRTFKSKVGVKALSIFLGLATCSPVAQCDDSSLNNSNPESEDSEESAILAIEKLVVENRRLKSEVAALSKAAANSSAESEVVKRQVTDLSQRMEALGASTATPSSLEQRVLQAANAMRLSEASKAELTAALARLAKVASEASKNAGPELKLVIESELKNVDKVLTTAVGGAALDEASKTSEAPANVTLGGLVSSVKPELGCVVLNIGTAQGVKVGMPFRVRRNAKELAIVRVVDARRSFSGAVIQKQFSDSDSVKLGDTISIDTQL